MASSHPSGTPRSNVIRSTIPHTRPRAHYALLDGLRGLAAALVVIYHLSSRIGPVGLTPHAYLMVDLFFCMSGFVLANAYGSTLADKRLTIGRFGIVRAVRLGPMLVLGASLGMVVMLPSLMSHTPDITLILSLFIKTSLLIPSPMPETLGPNVFPVNGVFWSLFFEVIANIVFAFVYRHAAWTRFWVYLALISGFVFSMIFILSNGGIEYAGVNYDHLLAGLPRVSFSFSVGLLLHRFRDTLPSINCPAFIPTVLTVALAAFPLLPDQGREMFDIVALTGIIPTIVYLGASGKPVNNETPLVRWSGLVSYPLYALHYPIVRVFGVVVRNWDPSGSLRLLAVVIILTLIVLFAATVERLVDSPVRRRLRCLMQRRPPASA